MSKGPGRLYISGEYVQPDTGLHSFNVRVPDGYRVTYGYFIPIEDQGVGHINIEHVIPSTDNLPAVVDGNYFNAMNCRYTQLTASKGVFYMVFFEPVDGSDLRVAE